MNCVKLDLGSNKAGGYLALPLRAGVRFFIFSIIDNWSGLTSERLDGNGINCKNGYHDGLRRYSHQELDWVLSYFRYVHASFLIRCTMDWISLVNTRLNPDELTRINNENNLAAKLFAVLKICLLQFMRQDWKTKNIAEDRWWKKIFPPFWVILNEYQPVFF